VFTFPAEPGVNLCGNDLGADGLLDAVCISLLRSAPVVEIDDLEMTLTACIAPGRLSPTELSTNLDTCGVQKRRGMVAARG
jgi:hypothetical protein